MDEQNALRSQGFTLMVFGGLIVLCSVFFILGMIVGRGQASMTAEGDEAIAASQPAAQNEADLDFYEAVTQDEFPPLEDVEPSPPPSSRPAPSAVPPVPAAAPPAPRPAANPTPSGAAVMLQLGAFRGEGQAEGLAGEVRAKGFSAIVLRPDPSDESGFYRVQVGPFTSADQADRVRGQLQDSGYEVISVR